MSANVAEERGACGLGVVTGTEPNTGVLLGIASMKITGDDFIPGFIPTGYVDPFVNTTPCWDHASRRLSLEEMWFRMFTAIEGFEQ